MLKDILKTIVRDGYISKSMLAAELKTSESVIEGGFNQLQRMGYIEKDEMVKDCGFDICPGCCKVNDCKLEVAKIYKFTDKGIAVIG